MNEVGGRKVVAKIQSDGGEASFLHADVAIERDVEVAAQKTVDSYGLLDIWVNNAGIFMMRKPVTECSEAEWDRVMAVNLKGTFFGSKHAIHQMLRQGSGGAIINIALTLGLVGEDNLSAYCASKGGVIAMTKALAVECAPHKIRVNCVCPGPIATPMALPEGLKEDEIDVSYVPLRRLGRPEEVAKAVLYLASHEASYVTGAVLAVDGGMLAL